MLDRDDLRSARFTWIATIMKGAKEQQIFNSRWLGKIYMQNLCACSLKLEHLLMTSIIFAHNVV